MNKKKSGKTSNLLVLYLFKQRIRKILFMWAIDKHVKTMDFYGVFGGQTHEINIFDFY